MVEDRLAALEKRLQQLEDTQEITQLIASYGPLVDSGSADEVGAIWEQDGVYDVDEGHFDGREQIIAMVNSTAHHRWIDGGCAHFLGPAHVSTSGDEAVAVCHSLMVVRTDGKFRLRRATAHHWQLRRGADGWQVAVRTSRVLDGRSESPALLAKGALGQPV